MISLETCPSDGDQFATSFHEVLERVDGVVSARFRDLRELANSSALLQDPAFSRLTETLQERWTGNSSDPWPGCVASSQDLVTQRRSLLRSAYVEACAFDPGTCDAALLSSAAGMPDDSSSAFAQQSYYTGLSALLQERVKRLDEGVGNVTRTALVDLWGVLGEDILGRVAALADSTDCRVPREALHEVVDGACFLVVFGLISIRDCFVWLGALTLLMSIMMYILWLRMTEYVALAEVHRNCLSKASTGGTAMNLTDISRQLAVGAMVADGAPDLEAKHGSPSSSVSPQGLPLRAAAPVVQPQVGAAKPCHGLSPSEGDERGHDDQPGSPTFRGCRVLAHL